MKRRIVLSLLLLFVLSASGTIVALVTIDRSTSTLGRLVTLHQIQNLRQHLVMTIQAVQSDLYSAHTPLGSRIDEVTEHVGALEGLVVQCGSCHHEPDVARRIDDVQTLIGEYQRSFSYYLTASANRERIEALREEAAGHGSRLLGLTEEMSRIASARLEQVTRSTTERVARVRTGLALGIGLTFVLGAVVAATLTRAVTRPVGALVNATREIASGNLGYTLSIPDRTEFGELAERFNEMSRGLKDGYARLEQEIESHRRATEALRESEERYALAARGANDGLWDWNLETNRVYYSDRWREMLGLAGTEVPQAPETWFSRIHPEDREEVEARLAAYLRGHAGHFESEHRVRHEDGTWRWMLARGVAVKDPDGRPLRMAGSQADVSARKAVESQLVHDAFHDALTGLPNRALFLDRVQHAITTAKRRADSLYAVLFLDVDRFKVVNDNLGHLVGDRLLVEVGHRLRGCLRPGDTSARLGGDEFGVLLENLHGAGDAAEVADRIRAALSAAVLIDGHEVYSTQSVGITLGSADYERPEQILRDADIAMYQAKAKGRARYEFFDRAMHEDVVNRLQLEADLRLAVEHGDQLVPYYQPILDVKSGRLVGFETLLRWRHPRRGMVEPAEFIPVAEETGMIVRIGEKVIRESCRQLVAWQRDFPSDPPLQVGMNVSARQFAQPGFADQVIGMVREAGLAPQSLILELTETVIMESTGIAVEAMEKLKGAGVQVHIDDFGTGYSSLAYLQRLPVSGLKIDRSFIRRMLSNQDDREIVRTIVSLAQSLKLDVVAEGVEELAQLREVERLDCLAVQGFLFSRPLDAASLESWIRDQARSGQRRGEEARGTGAGTP